LDITKVSARSGTFVNFPGGKMATEKIRVRLRAFDVELIDQSAKAIVQTVQKAGAKVSGPIPLPTRIQNKKSREQFELSSYKRLIDIYSSTSKTVDALMKLELPSGVEVEIKV